MAGKAKYIIFGVVGGLVGALVLVWILTTFYSGSPNQYGSTDQTTNSDTTVQMPQDYDVPLYSETMAINAGAAKQWKVRIDISEKTRNVIEGRLEELSGHGINFWILDTKNYNSWRADGSNIQPYVREKNVVNYNFSFIPDHSDDYYFVFDNTNSILTNKLVKSSASWKYRQ